MPKPLQVVNPPWQACVLVCRKCSKKAGKKDGKRLLRGLRDVLRARHGKKRARIVEVGCLDLCPKGRIVVGLNAPGAPLKLVLAEPDQTPEAVLEALG